MLCQHCEIVDLGQCRRVYEVQIIISVTPIIGTKCAMKSRVRDHDRGIRRRAGKGLSGAEGPLFAIMGSHPIGLAEAPKETW
jgi:hypothetical protein